MSDCEELVGVTRLNSKTDKFMSF